MAKLPIVRRLASIPRSPIGEVAELPAEHLALLQEDAAAASTPASR